MTESRKIWERRWQIGDMRYHQGLYLIPLVQGGVPTVAVRVTIQVSKAWFERDSSATAELFDGTMWRPVSGLPSPLMKSGLDLGFTDRDVGTLLHDASLALGHRAPGPFDYARIQREAPEQDG